MHGLETAAEGDFAYLLEKWGVVSVQGCWRNHKKSVPLGWARVFIRITEVIIVEGHGVVWSDVVLRQGVEELKYGRTYERLTHQKHIIIIALL